MIKRLLLACLLVFIVAAAIAYLSLNASYQGFQNPVILDFPKGTSTEEMADQLAQNGVIRYPWQFLLARAIHRERRLQAGEYQFAHADSPSSILDRIARGDVFFYELTVPEGANIFDIAASVARFDFLKSADFLREARNPALVHDLAPQAPTLEGYLFPATYRITRSTTVQQLCAMMTGQFRRQWRELQGSAQGRPVNDVVTMASLVEKETGRPEDRPVVASVYENRLRKGMALDCDPTTIYASLLDARYRGTIYRSDLNSDNTYNTYRHAGLPPGPIANPGLASLKAALMPAQTNYFYFVAKPDGSGGHQFSETMAEHDVAVQKYRRANRTPDATAPQPPASSHPPASSKTHRAAKRRRAA